MSLDDSAPAMGHNVPDYAKEELGRLALEFDGLEAETSALLDEARSLPPTVEDEETAAAFTSAIKRFRDLDKKIEAFREGEKLPYLRRGTAVDTFFNRMRDRLFRRRQTDKAGGADVLLARLHAYNERRRIEEQRRREEEARIAREAEERARREREEQERAAREAELKASRARSEENRRKAETDAAEKRRLADEARAREDEERARRQETEIARNAKTADLVRERHATGAVNTMKDVWHVEVVDAMLLDPVALWPFVKDDHKRQALEAWAKITQYRTPMNGALIEKRAKTRVI